MAFHVYEYNNTVTKDQRIAVSSFTPDGEVNLLGTFQTLDAVTAAFPQWPGLAHQLDRAGLKM